MVAHRGKNDVLRESVDFIIAAAAAAFSCFCGVLCAIFALFFSGHFQRGSFQLLGLSLLCF